MTHRIETPIRVIIDAYLKDELKPGNPCKCFCGNWFSDANLQFVDSWYNTLNAYRNNSCTGLMNLIVLHEIKKTGYSIQEIDAIESTFEDTAKQLLIPVYGTDDYYVAIREYRSYHPEARMEDVDTLISTIWEGIDLFPAVLATFNKLVELEENREQAQEILDRALVEIG